MRPGPAPKPTKLKALEGNRGKKRLRKDEPQPNTPLGACPSHLSGFARKMWNELGAELDALGIATGIDRAIFELYCQTYQTYRETLSDCQEHGNYVVYESGAAQVAPWFTANQKSKEQLRMLAAELGATPAARTRVSSVKAKKSKPNPLETWLAQKGKGAVIQGGKK